MAQRIISVDAGRSSVKTVDENFEKLLIESRHGGIDFNKSKRSPFALFSPRTDIIASIDGGQPLVLGKFVDTMCAPEDIIYVTEDKLYLEYSRAYNLASVARKVANGDTVVFSANLTSNNFKWVSEFKDSVLGEHLVVFYNPRGQEIDRKAFTITNAVIVNQGLSSVMSVAIRDDLTYDERYFKMGIVIDIGRRTVDTLLVNRLNLVKDKGFDNGTEFVFHEIKEALFERYDLHYDNFDIERMVVNNDLPVGKNDEIIEFATIRAAAVAKVSEKIRNQVREHFGSYNPSWIMVTGGGVLLVGDVLRQIFPSAVIPADPVWTNAVGLEKLALKGMQIRAK